MTRAIRLGSPHKKKIKKLNFLINSILNGKIRKRKSILKNEPKQHKKNN